MLLLFNTYGSMCSLLHLPHTQQTMAKTLSSLKFDEGDLTAQVEEKKVPTLQYCTPQLHD